MTSRAPKQWCLTKNETITSFESWKQNLNYILSLDPTFAPFLLNGVEWSKKSKSNPTRGFTDDATTVAEASRRNKEQKVTHLELMLGQIANYCPIISRNSIIKNSTSIDNIWQTIRAHYGFQSNGSHFLDFVNIKLEPEERHEDLYQRIVAFIDDNLMLQNGGITHHGESPSEDEELSPSLENLVTLIWLNLIHKDLPSLVKQRYGTELRSKSLASIKPEISQAMDSLLETLRTSEDARVMRSASSYSSGPRFRSNTRSNSSNKFNKGQQPSKKVCPLCKSSNRAYNHYLSTCNFLPESDKKFLTRARLISAIDEEQFEYNEEDDVDLQESVHPTSPAVHLTSATHRVQVNRSPFVYMHHNHHPVKLTLDSGAETSMIKESVAKHIGAHISKSTQTALQADGSSPLSIKGETCIELHHDGTTYHFEALVVEDIDVDILAGVPFMFENDITVRPAKHQVLFSNGSSYFYNHKNSGMDNRPHIVRLTNSHILRSPQNPTVIWPGEYIEVELPPEFPKDVTVAVEPRIDSKTYQREPNWPAPEYLTPIARKIRIPNNTSSPKVLGRNEQFSQLLSVTYPEDDNISISKVTQPKDNKDSSLHLITVDPSNYLESSMKQEFINLHNEYSSVFSSSIGCYNGKLGPIEAVVNMGPVLPPQRKGRIPQYSKDKLSLLQNKFDELEQEGVFQKPEDIGVVAEYLNPSFLIKKPSGGYRLVTSFGEVAKYAKPQPALMPDINATIRNIGNWHYIITTDLTKAFYQIPLSKESFKYCGVATPYRGVRLYTRCAMGMPGSETVLEQLMCTVLGDLVQEGVVAKVADDLYCGGSTPDELLIVWRRVLSALSDCNLSLSPSKTIIAPKSTTILGWIWENGTIRASPHRISTLSTCSIPSTIRSLRSFLGAYKFLSRVIPNCSAVLSPLESIVAGRKSQEKITWSDGQLESFKYAQKFISNNKTITLPRANDQLWLVTDGAVKDYGLGATLYITRCERLYVAGFFSTKLQKRQCSWIPCEIEALCIGAALRHFSPYIIQSSHKTIVLTDSKPCVQAYQKLCRGEYSNSARVSTFLSVASRYEISMTHLAGTSNVPSDFASRNAAVCTNHNCQICGFVSQMEDSVVHSVSVQDVIKGSSKMPFITRSTWLTTQGECADLRRSHAHLLQGTRPSKKSTHIKDVKRYLNVASIAKDGMLVVKQTDAFSPTRERIIVPRPVLYGLLTALHIRLDHPTAFQLKQLFNRYFYALNLDEAIQHTTDLCHRCASLKLAPKFTTTQTTSQPPDAVGISFAADVMKQNNQLILIFRESVTSFTTTCIISDEGHIALRDGLLKLAVELMPLDGPPAVVRVDPAPGFSKLKDDEILCSHRVTLEVGRVKNKNKNPVAEKAVRELEDELIRLNPNRNLVTPSLLAIATARLNTRIRNQGLSSRELWTQRDQFTHDQLPLCDRDIIQTQHNNRLANHSVSERCKGRKNPDNPPIKVGDLVYLYSDKDKCKARNRYIVISMDDGWCTIRKFVGNQLRNTGYKVRTTECYTIPCHEGTNRTVTYDTDDNEDAGECHTLEHPGSEITPPTELTLPPEPELEIASEVVPVSSVTEDTVDSIITPPDILTEDSLRRSSRSHAPPAYLIDYELS